MQTRINVYAVLLDERTPQGHRTGRQLMVQMDAPTPGEQQPAIFADYKDALVFKSDVEARFPNETYETQCSAVYVDLPESFEHKETFPGAKIQDLSDAD